MQMKWSEWLAASDEAGFSAIPAGEYDLYIDTATAKESSSGKPMIALKFKVEAGPHEGASVFSNFVISQESPAALSFLIRKLAALGLDRAYLAGNPPLEKIASDLESRRCTGKVTVREYNGSERNDVDTLRPPADGVTHRASGPVPDSALGVFGSFTPATASASSSASGSRHGHGQTGPELPF